MTCGEGKPANKATCCIHAHLGAQGRKDVHSNWPVKRGRIDGGGDMVRRPICRDAAPLAVPGCQSGRSGHLPPRERLPVQLLVLAESRDRASGLVDTRRVRSVRSTTVKVWTEAAENGEVRCLYDTMNDYQIEGCVGTVYRSDLRCSAHRATVACRSNRLRDFWRPLRYELHLRASRTSSFLRWPVDNRPRSAM